MGRLKLMVLYGGISEEHPVSVKSAVELSQNLDPSKYEALYVFIGRDGLWRLADPPGDDPDAARVALAAGGAQRGLLRLETGRYETLPVDAAFPALHGRFGEDGTIQGLLEAAGIPYVGCGIAASALCMDKALTYRIAAASGVNVPRHRTLLAQDEAAAGEIGYPLFVKPARSGSSFGVSKVETPSALSAAVAQARRYDEKVLVEEAVVGTEVGCAVLGDPADPFVGEPDQITLSGGFFRIHQEEKPEQGSENATIRVPADIPEAARRSAIETAKTVYRSLGCRGLARVDLFVTPRGQVVLNEVNTMPGLTSYSRYPRMMAAAGLSLAAVADRLIASAMEGEKKR